MFGNIDQREGEHLFVFVGSQQLDAVAFRARKTSYDVRDIVKVQSSGTSLFALLFQRHTDKTILENVVRCGVGTMNIGDCRIGDETRVNAPMAPNGNCYGYVEISRQTQKEVEGRWPTNMVLVHTSRCTLKEDEDNDKEWCCSSRCPAHKLDQQSGERPSTLSAKGEGGEHPSSASYGDKTRRSFREGLDMPGSHVYGDSGGASRFFHQASSLEEALEYLSILSGTKVKKAQS